MSAKSMDNHNRWRSVTVAFRVSLEEAAQLNRFVGLSKKNNWLDEQDRVFIYYTVDEIIEKMGCCKQKALKLLNELKEFGLIECERIGLTKPNRIYVKTYY